MQDLILLLKQTTTQQPLPFSVYSSVKEQHLINVPVIKPLLICVLDGSKKLGPNNEISCPVNSFVFLSNTPTIHMRNIPERTEYFALVIEFEFEDFYCFSSRSIPTKPFFQGKIDLVFQQTLMQFVHWSAFAPPEMWPIRKQEILQMLDYLGYNHVRSVIRNDNLSHKLHEIISADPSQDITTEMLCSRLAMSEATLRRKLKAEGTPYKQSKTGSDWDTGCTCCNAALSPSAVLPNNAATSHNPVSPINSNSFLG